MRRGLNGGKITRNELREQIMTSSKLSTRFTRTAALMVFSAVLILAVSTANGILLNMVNYPNSQNGCTISGTVVGSGGGTNDEGSITS